MPLTRIYSCVTSLGRQNHVNSLLPISQYLRGQDPRDDAIVKKKNTILPNVTHQRSFSCLNCVCSVLDIVTKHE